MFHTLNNHATTHHDLNSMNRNTHAEWSKDLKLRLYNDSEDNLRSGKRFRFRESKEMLTGTHEYTCRPST